MATEDQFRDALIGLLNSSAQAGDLTREVVTELIAIRRTLQTLGPQVAVTLENETIRAKSLISGQIQTPAVPDNLSGLPKQGQD